MAHSWTVDYAKYESNGSTGSWLRCTTKARAELSQPIPERECYLFVLLVAGRIMESFALDRNTSAAYAGKGICFVVSAAGEETRKFAIRFQSETEFATGLRIFDKIIKCVAGFAQASMPAPCAAQVVESESPDTEPPIVGVTTEENRITDLVTEADPLSALKSEIEQILADPSFPAYVALVEQVWQSLFPPS